MLLSELRDLVDELPEDDGLRTFLCREKLGVDARLGFMTSSNIGCDVGRCLMTSSMCVTSLVEGMILLLKSTEGEVEGSCDADIIGGRGFNKVEVS